MIVSTWLTVWNNSSITNRAFLSRVLLEFALSWRSGRQPLLLGFSVVYYASKTQRKQQMCFFRLPLLHFPWWVQNKNCSLLLLSISESKHEFLHNFCQMSSVTGIASYPDLFILYFNKNLLLPLFIWAVYIQLKRNPGGTEILTAVCVFWETFYFRLKNYDMKNIFLQNHAKLRKPS